MLRGMISPMNSYNHTWIQLLLKWKRNSTFIFILEIWLKDMTIIGTIIKTGVTLNFSKNLFLRSNQSKCTMGIIPCIKFQKIGLEWINLLVKYNCFPPLVLLEV